MKILILVLLLVTNVVFADNTATARDSFVILNNRGENITITPYTIVIDTVDEELIVAEGVEDKFLGIFGIGLINDIDYELTLISGATDLDVYTLGAKNGLSGRVQSCPSFVAEKGEDLAIKSSAVLNKFTLYVASFTRLSC